MSALSPGTRVRIVRAGVWPVGATGTIGGTTSIRSELDAPPEIEWQSGVRVVETRSGHRSYYFVEFDSPQDDGSGDGPYIAAEVEESYLAPLDDAEAG